MPRGWWGERRLLGWVVGGLLLPHAGCALLAPQYPGHAAVLRAGAAHDVAVLETLRDRYAPVAAPEERFVIFLASRAAEPGRWADELTAAFPACMDEPWPKLDDPSAAGAWKSYAAGELAAIAESGNPRAIRKLVETATWIDGAAAEAVFAGFVRTLVRAPDETLAALSRLRPGARHDVLGGAFREHLLDEDVPDVLDAVQASAWRGSAAAGQVESEALAVLGARHRLR